MKQHESEHQQAFFTYLRAIEKHYPMVRWCHSIPNGGSRNKIEAARLKREGVKAGVLDVFLPYPSKGFHGLYIEFKYGKNKLTDNQKEFQEYANRVGYKTVVAYTWGEAKEAVKWYLDVK